MSRTVRVAMAVVVLLLLLILVGPFLVPMQPLQATVSPEELADPDSRFVEVNGLQVHYKMKGAGRPAMILLHGFGASVFSWREVLEPLATAGTVIAYDRPAFGLTERPLTWDHGSNPYTTQAQVALVVNLMDALGVEEAVLIGHSAGGTIALQTALANPDRTRGLVLVAAAVYEGGGSPHWLRPLLDIPQINRLGPLLARRIETRGDLFLEAAWHDPDRITPQVREGYRRPLQADNWDYALWELTKASRRPQLTSRLHDLNVPSLVITGAHDRFVPVQSSRRLADELPDAQLVVIPDCGHLPHEESPAFFLDVVRGFVEELSP